MHGDSSLNAASLQVITTPFSTGFNHLRIADEIHYKWDRCVNNPWIAAEIKNLPIFGLGHSMGSLQHLLISARYASTNRAGNILMSFNNKPATDAIPFFSPFIAPGARALGPFLAQVSVKNGHCPVAPCVHHQHSCHLHTYADMHSSGPDLACIMQQRCC